MEVVHIRPDPKYRQKLYLGVAIVAVFTLLLPLGIIAIVGLGMMLSPAGVAGVAGLGLIGFGIIVTNVLWLVPAVVLVGKYYDSIRYEIEDDEVIVRQGVITHSVKHVPYRTVTNITVRRDPFDRFLFNIGTLRIQTAGMSGTTGAEEVLAGLSDYEGTYQTVAQALRRFRASGATTTEVEPAAVLESASLSEILAELRAIRAVLEGREEG